MARRGEGKNRKKLMVSTSSIKIDVPEYRRGTCYMKKEGNAPTKKGTPVANAIASAPVFPLAS